MLFITRRILKLEKRIGRIENKIIKTSEKNRELNKRRK